MAAERVRLYVGGLGPSVSEEDLKRALGSLGQVDSVELVRTKGRDFAFVDFEAASAAALRKVFSTYSGCKWKGGCLRVEKAKEDYMIRLRREWEAERALVDQSKPETAPKPREADSLDISIYFPKLRKKKCVPGKGTGRHKRSFERVQALPFAVLRLCDCDEHENQPDAFDCEHDQYLKQIEQLEKRSGALNFDPNEQKQPEKEDLADKKEAKDSEEDSPWAEEAEVGLIDKSNSICEAQTLSEENEDEEGSQSEEDSEQTSDTDESKSSSKEDVQQEDDLDDDQPTTSKWDRLFKAAASVGNNEGSPKDKRSRKRKVDAETAELPVSKPKQATEVQTTAATEQRPPSTQCSWVQRGSWKDMVGATGLVSFSLGSFLGSSEAKTVPGPSVASSAQPAQPSQPAQAPVQAVKSPATRSRPSSTLEKPLKSVEHRASPSSAAAAAAAAAAAKSNACIFMRPAGAEEHWLSSKEKLRSDFKAQHKAAVKMKRKLSGLRS